MSSEHLSKQFDADLETLRSGVLQMGGLVESQIRGAIEAFASGNSELIEQIIASEARVNECEVQIDDDCSHIIVKRQPAAGDLRLIMAISKTVTDLERIDEAERSRACPQIHERGVRTSIGSPISAMRPTLHLPCCARRSTRSPDRPGGEHHPAGRGHRYRIPPILRQLITCSMEDSRTISTARVSDAKAIERIGDHAKNIAEDVIYIVKGTDVRHTAVEVVEREALG
jgi:phosphate transport system protein